MIEKPNECKEIMEKDGISDLFAKHVSHAIHSLTVEDLRMYFNKDAGENNNIPVGEMNYRIIELRNLTIDLQKLTRLSPT